MRAPNTKNQYTIQRNICCCSDGFINNQAGSGSRLINRMFGYRNCRHSCIKKGSRRRHRGDGCCDTGSKRYAVDYPDHEETQGYREPNWVTQKGSLRKRMELNHRNQ